MKRKTIQDLDWSWIVLCTYDASFIASRCFPNFT